MANGATESDGMANASCENANDEKQSGSCLTNDAIWIDGSGCECSHWSGICVTLLSPSRSHSLCAVSAIATCGIWSHSYSLYAGSAISSDGISIHSRSLYAASVISTDRTSNANPTHESPSGASSSAFDSANGGISSDVI